MLNDEYFINKFFNKDGKLNGNLTKKLSGEELSYLKGRFDDIPESFYSNREVLVRIYNKIYSRPVCLYCHKPVKFIGKKKLLFQNYCCPRCIALGTAEKANKTRLEKYGSESVLGSDYGQRKYKETCLKRYGFNNGSKSDIVKEKIKQTNIKKYNKDWYVQTDDFKEKSSKTNKEKYGENIYVRSEDFKLKSAKSLFNKFNYDCPFKSPAIKKKIKEITLKKYGDEIFFKTEFFKNKLNDYLRKYNVNNISQIGFIRKLISEKLSLYEIQNKINKTKKENHSFNSSKTETLIFNSLKKIYPDTLSQYRSSEYPFNCDFYIPELKLYIEYNGHWTHNDHPFNKNNEADLNKLNEIKSFDLKSHPAYNALISTWSIKDVQKIKTAKENNINCIIIYKGWFDKNKNNLDENIRHLIWQYLKSGLKLLIVE